MKYNPNKSVSANKYGITIYTDNKSHNIYYDEGSSLKNLQMFGTHKVQTIVRYELNDTQKELYNLAMYGIKTLSHEQVKSLSYIGKLRIINTFEEAQIKLNIWKQELVHNKINTFFSNMSKLKNLGIESSSLFKFTFKIATYPKSVSSWEPCSITFKQLNIKKEQIIDKLIEWEILPNDYYKLT